MDGGPACAYIQLLLNDWICVKLTFLYPKLACSALKKSKLNTKMTTSGITTMKCRESYWVVFLFHQVHGPTHFFRHVQDTGILAEHLHRKEHRNCSTGSKTSRASMVYE